jgi:penicillin-binding protein 2
VDRIAHWAHLLGLGKRTGIALAHEKPGLIPSSEWKRKRYHERWYPAETLSVAIGQGYVAVTPLQLAVMAATIANGGTRYQPQFVRQVESLDGTPVRTYPPVVEGRAEIDPQVLDIVRAAMCDVVNGPGGTAHKAALPNVTVCGKTGTAQVVAEKQGARIKENALPSALRDNGWFIAFAPRDHPQIAIAAIFEHSGHGGSSAAPAVHDILEKFFAEHPPGGATPSAPPVPVPQATTVQPEQEQAQAVQDQPAESDSDEDTAQAAISDPDAGINGPADSQPAPDDPRPEDF